MMAICGNCRETHEIAVWNGINAGEHPELKEKVKDGSLFLWECPHCGASNLVSCQTLYHDPSECLMIWHIPENSVPEEQIASVTVQLKDLEGYTLRRVDDIGSLIEKVNLFDAGFDDIVIEMCKYVVKMELTAPAEGTSAPDKAETVRQAPFKFYKLDGADNDLIFSYPLDGQMHGIKIGFSVYEDCRGIVSRNPGMIPDPGFARIDAAWLERFFG